MEGFIQGNNTVNNKDVEIQLPIYSWVCTDVSNGQCNGNGIKKIPSQT